MTIRQTSDPEPSGRERVLLVADLVAVAATAVATLAVAVTAGRFGGPAPLRVPLGFLFVFLLPGYAVTSALFPGRTLRIVGGSASSRTVTVGGVQRLALSVGLSIFLVPLVGLSLTLLGQQLTMVTVLGTIAAVTVAGCVAGAIRRFHRSPEDVWRPRLGVRARAGVDHLRGDRLNVVLAAFVLLSVGGVGAAIATPESGERYTEFGLLAPGDDGQPAAANYPQEIVRGTEETLYVQIGNKEGETVRYRVVVLLQETTGDVDSRTIQSEVRLDAFGVRLADGERATYEHTVVPPVTGDDMQLTYLLYRGSVPDDPSRANALESTHLEIDVIDAAE